MFASLPWLLGRSLLNYYSFPLVRFLYVILPLFIHYNVILYIVLCLSLHVIFPHNFILRLPRFFWEVSERKAAVQLSQHHLVKRLFLLVYSCLLCQNQLAVRVYSGLCSAPLISVSVLCQCHLILWQQLFVRQFEIQKQDNSNFVLFQDCFGYSRSFVVPCKL